MGENAVDTLKSMGLAHLFSNSFIVGQVTIGCEFFEVGKDQMEPLRAWMRNTSVCGPSPEDLRNNLGWVNRHDKFFIEITETDGEVCYVYSFYVLQDHTQILHLVCEDFGLNVPLELCRSINTRTILAPSREDNLKIASQLIWGMFAAIAEV